MKSFARIVLATAALVFLAGIVEARPGGLKPAPAKKHALVRALSVAAVPVAHPKRTLKEILGSVLFAVEPVVDVASLGFQALDKAASVELKHNPFEYLALGAEKADAGIELAEDFFFGRHN